MKPRWTSLAAGLWTGGVESVDWPRLAQAALDRDLLGPVDLKLIRAVAARAGRPSDGALLVVLGCLAASVRSGAMRIPCDPLPLAERLESFLRGLHAGSTGAAPGAPAPGSAAAAASAVAGGSVARDLAAWAAALAEGFHAARESGAYAAILASSPEEFKPLIRSGRSLYFQKFHAAEALAGTRLASLIASPDRDLPADSARTILDTVLDKFPLRLGRGPDAPPMLFRGGQKLALALGLRKRLLVISGGPGTGKTSLAANLLRAHLRLPRSEGSPLRIRLAAPTGRAAQRLTESLAASLASLAHAPGGQVSGSAPAGGDASAAPAGADSVAVREAALDAPLARLSGETLHRLLRYEPGRGEFHHRRGRPVPADLVVVDEVSMVDIFLLGRLLDALEDGACLILLGDMDQLPSVEAGAVLADLVPARKAFAPSPALRAWLEAVLPGEVPAPAGAEPASSPPASPSPIGDNLALLDGSHRSEAGILEVTLAVNAQDGAAALEAMLPPAGLPGPGPWTVTRRGVGPKITPGGGCRLLLPPSDSGAPSAGLHAWLESWAAFHYLGNAEAPEAPAYADLVRNGESSVEALAGMFACLDRARILTFTRKNWHGSDSVNRWLRDRLAPDWDRMGPTAGSGAFHGAPILVLENDYAQDLFNGEVGVMLRTRGRYQAWFRKDGGYRSCPASLLPRHELAFATTVHKAQGSEYDQVMIVLPEPGNRLLYKETLYTAITRARIFAGLYGPAEVFLEAVGRKVARESGLREFLAALPKGGWT